MKIWHAGDKGKAACEHCRQIVTTTFGYHDVPFESGRGVARQIMAATCDSCGTVVAIPPQSTPAIRDARDLATEPLEVMVPAPFLDALDLAAYRIDPSAGVSLRKPLITYFLRRAASDAEVLARLCGYAQTQRKIWKGWRDEPVRRISMKVSSRMRDDLDKLARETTLNRTTLIKSIVADITCEIVEPDEPAMLPELRRMAAAVAA